MSSSGKCTIGPARATADCAYVPRAIREPKVRNAQGGAPELVARIRLESELAAPRSKDLPSTPRRKDRKASWPASLLEKREIFLRTPGTCVHASPADPREGQ